MDLMSDDNEIRLIKLLPFMNEIYLKRLFNLTGHNITQVKIIYMLDMPGKN